MSIIQNNTLISFSDWRGNGQIVTGALDPVASDLFGDMQARLDGETLTTQRITVTPAWDSEVSYTDAQGWYVSAGDIVWNAGASAWQAFNAGVWQLKFQDPDHPTAIGITAQKVTVTVGIVSTFTQCYIEFNYIRLDGAADSVSKTFDTATDPFTTSGGYNHFTHEFDFGEQVRDLGLIQGNQLAGGANMRVENLDWYKYSVIAAIPSERQFDTIDATDVERGYSLINPGYSDGGRVLSLVMFLDDDQLSNLQELKQRSRYIHVTLPENVFQGLIQEIKTVHKGKYSISFHAEKAIGELIYPDILPSNPWFEDYKFPDWTTSFPTTYTWNGVDDRWEHNSSSGNFYAIRFPDIKGDKARITFGTKVGQDFVEIKIRVRFVSATTLNFGRYYNAAVDPNTIISGWHVFEDIILDFDVGVNGPVDYIVYAGGFSEPSGEARIYKIEWLNYALA